MALFENFVIPLQQIAILQMKRIFLMMAFTIALMTDVAAQRHRVKTVAPIDSMATVNAYLDSLLSYRQKQMSEETTETELDGRYYRLFAPLTFYHSPAGRALAFSADSLGEDEVTGEVDAALKIGRASCRERV